MNYKPLLLGAAIYAGFTLFKKKSAASGLVYSIASAQPSFDGITPIITLKVSIENSSDSQFLIKGIAGNVSANDNVIGNVSNYAQVNINPRSTSYYFLPVRLSIIGLATDIYNTLTGNGSLSQEIVFNGAANVDGLDIPLKLNFLVG